MVGGRPNVILQVLICVSKCVVTDIVSNYLSNMKHMYHDLLRISRSSGLYLSDPVEEWTPT